MKRCPVIVVLLCTLAALLGQGPASAMGPTAVAGLSTGESLSPLSDDYSHFFLTSGEANPWWDTDTVVDSSGGIHVTYYENDIYYAYCPAGCSNPANWAATTVGDAESSLAHTTLAVDSSGRPRLMWYEFSTGYYSYAECAGNCTGAGSWTVVSVPLPDYGYGYPETSGYFSLDGQNRPRFISPWSGGFLYHSCESDCTNDSNWNTSTITLTNFPEYANLDGAQLLFGTDDRPRIAGYEDVNDNLTYVDCQGDCSQPASWSYAAVSPMGFGWIPDYGFSLRLDAQDRPRIAFYKSDEDALYFAWSDSDFTNPAGWSSYSVNLAPGDDRILDLALDGQGRPRVAFASDQLDLDYAECTADCTSSGAVWQRLSIETGDELDQSEPIPLPPGCLSGAWMVFGWPSLALDAAGGANVSYYVRHGTLCPDGQGGYDILYDATRIRFSLPGGGTTTPVAPGQVTISGPTMGQVDVGYTFTATVSPVSTTLPLTYTWQATGQAEQIHTGRGLSDAAGFTWPAGEEGVKAVTVTVANATGTVGGSRTILILAEPIQFDHWAYLPVVWRNGGGRQARCR